MNETNQRPPVPDVSKYDEGLRNFPPEELAKYTGLHVAFSLDGTRIVASGKSWDELFDNMEAAGIDASQVVGSYVPPPDMVLL